MSYLSKIFLGCEYVSMKWVKFFCHVAILQLSFLPYGVPNKAFYLYHHYLTIMLKVSRDAYVQLADATKSPESDVADV